jgi:hypothetical protein
MTQQDHSLMSRPLAFLLPRFPLPLEPFKLLRKSLCLAAFLPRRAGDDFRQSAFQLSRPLFDIPHSIEGSKFLRRGNFYLSTSRCTISLVFPSTAHIFEPSSFFYSCSLLRVRSLSTSGTVKALTFYPYCHSSNLLAFAENHAREGEDECEKGIYRDLGKDRSASAGSAEGVKMPRAETSGAPVSRDDGWFRCTSKALSARRFGDNPVTPIRVFQTIQEEKAL